MRASLTGLPLVLGLCLPSVAWAGGTAGVPPLVSKGVDAKDVNNVTGLLSSELDFSGAYDTVQDVPASGALTVACLTQPACLQGVARAAGVDALLTGSIGSGPKGLQIYLVLYDATKNTVVRKKTFDLGADVSSLAETAPKMVKEILGQGAPQTAEAKAAASPSFEDAEDDEFEMEKKPAATAAASKTKITVQAKPGELEDEIDPEEEAEAERERQAQAKAQADADRRAREEQARKAREEQERLAREEQARKAREEQARRDREEAARRAEAARLAQEEEERQAREEEARRQKAVADARAREAAMAKTKAKAPPPPAEEEEEDLSDELASFSFGDSSSAIAVDGAGDDAEETPRSFSEKYGTGSAPAAKKTTATPKRTTVTERRVEEFDDADEFEPESEEEESPDFDEEETRPSTRRASRDEDEEDANTRRSSRDDEDDSDTRRSSRDDSRSRRTPDFGEEGTKRRTAFDDEPSEAKVALAGRVGFAKYDVFNFITYGAEITVPVVDAVVIAAGIEGFSTQRHLTDEAIKEISQETSLLPAEINPDPWNTILPINVGVQYKGGKKKVHPYAGVDLTMTPYSSDFDLAFGARARGGVDLLVADNFGFNFNVSLGFMSGDKFELTESGVGNMGFLPQASLGTLVAF
jgi:hypothetical protein